ncbi:MAG: N-acetylmuramoyl-L-alanine amidase, partial [Clostridiaceae bacterium]|nr:N-acetylmuramoyl-L-alanine amidase [Clostridiaceae bacterium]
HAAWHCGTKGTYYHPACRNANSIGVEVCMLDKHGKLRQGSVDRAAALVRELMQRYGIPADRVVRHYDVTHKDCPAPMVQNPALWQAFKTKLTQEEDNDMKYYEKLTEIPAGELRETVQLLIDRGAIAGTSSGLHLSEDMVRMMVYNRRMGLYK